MTSIKEALEFYADPLAWKKKHDTANVVGVPDFYDELSFGDTAKEALAQLESADARERIALQIMNDRFIRRGVEPVTMVGVQRAKEMGHNILALDLPTADAILATGLVPDEAAIRVELLEARQEAADSLAVLDAIADYVGCPHDEELTVDHVRQHYMKLENAAQRQGIEDAGRIANAQAYATVNEAAIRANEREKCANICRQIGINAGRRAAEHDNDEARNSALDKMEGAIQCEAAIRAGRAEK